MSTIIKCCLVGFLTVCHTLGPYYLSAQDWFRTGSEPGKYDMGGDPTIEHGSENPAFIRSNTTNIEGFGSWATSISAAPYRNQAISVSAYVQSTEVQDWASLWLRVDGDDGSLTFDNMLWRSIQGSTDWQKYQVTLDVPEESTRIFFGALLVGEGTLLFDGLEITDAPRTWIPQKTPENVHAFCIDAVGEEMVWAGGVEGKFLRTTNGGVTWTQGSIPGADSLIVNSIVAVDDLTAYVAAQSFDLNRSDARIYKTIDGGLEWDLQYRNTKKGAFFNSIAFWDAQHGIAISDPVEGAFLVVTTTDGGLTWKETPKEAIPEPQPGEIAGFGDLGGTTLTVTSDQHAWFGTALVDSSGGSIRIFRTNDRGQSWTAVSTPWDSTEIFRGVTTICFPDTSFGMAGSAYQELGESLLVTYDGGRTWTINDSFPMINPSTIAIVPHSTSDILVTSLQGSAISTDKGVTWQELSTQPHTGLSLVNANVGWAVRAFDGEISKFAPSETTSTRSVVAAQVSKQLSLEPIFPNPFRGSATIEFTIPKMHHVRLEILDIRGRMMQLIAKETYYPGTHQVAFEFSDHPPGVYFVRMNAGDFTTSRRVTFIP